MSSSGDGGLRPREHGRVSQQQLERPRESGRRRLVARDDQRHELVAQLRVRHRLALLVRRHQQHREHVRALGEILGVAPARDLGVDHLVHRLPLTLEALDPARHTEPPPDTIIMRIAARFPTGSSIVRMRRLSSS